MGFKHGVPFRQIFTPSLSRQIPENADTLSDIFMHSPCMVCSLLPKLAKNLHSEIVPLITVAYQSVLEHDQDRCTIMAPVVKCLRQIWPVYSLLNKYIENPAQYRETARSRDLFFNKKFPNSSTLV